MDSVEVDEQPMEVLATSAQRSKETRAPSPPPRDPEPEPVAKQIAGQAQDKKAPTAPVRRNQTAMPPGFPTTGVDPVLSPAGVALDAADAQLSQGQRIRELASISAALEVARSSTAMAAQHVRTLQLDAQKPTDEVSAMSAEVGQQPTSKWDSFGLKLGGKLLLIDHPVVLDSANMVGAHIPEGSLALSDPAGFQLDREAIKRHLVKAVTPLRISGAIDAAKAVRDHAISGQLCVLDENLGIRKEIPVTIPLTDPDTWPERPRGGYGLGGQARLLLGTPSLIKLQLKVDYENHSVTYPYKDASGHRCEAQLALADDCFSIHRRPFLADSVAFEPIAIKPNHVSQDLDVYISTLSYSNLRPAQPTLVTEGELHVDALEFSSGPGRKPIRPQPQGHTGQPRVGLGAACTGRTRLRGIRLQLLGDGAGGRPLMAGGAGWGGICPCQMTTTRDSHLAVPPSGAGPH